MAITQVVASLYNDNIVMQDDGTEYSGALIVPSDYGSYDATVSAYDDSGNVTIAKKAVSVLQWIEPKTNWTANDRFNIQDYNRIKNNLSYIHEKANIRIAPFEIEDMGENLVSYAPYWDVGKFNAFENNLDVINSNIQNKNFGAKQVFFENGPFIRFDELNRIESAILDMKESIDNLSAGLRRIPFRLGVFRKIRI